MLAWRRKGEDAPGLKAPKKEKHVRRETRTRAPVETPYVPPRQKPSAKSFHDKTVEIFEGMTILELAKRTGASIGSLQEIMKNVGEKVDSEFDPISVDVAELVAMVKFFCRWPLNSPTVLLFTKLNDVISLFCILRIFFHLLLMYT